MNEHVLILIVWRKKNMLSVGSKEMDVVGVYSFFTKEDLFGKKINSLTKIDKSDVKNVFNINCKRINR